MEFSITLVIIIITMLISIGAFNNERIINELIFYPPSVNRGQWYRLFSCGLIHADWGHLIFNMLALYMFGKNVENVFNLQLFFYLIWILNENREWGKIINFVWKWYGELEEKNTDRNNQKWSRWCKLIIWMQIITLLMKPNNSIWEVLSSYETKINNNHGNQGY